MDFPTLTMTPSYPLNESEEDNQIASPTEAGYKITRPRFTRARRKFIITYEFLTPTDKATLETFYRTSCNYGASLFNWTHPESLTVYIVKFAKPISYTATSVECYTAAIELEEP